MPTVTTDRYMKVDFFRHNLDDACVASLVEATKQVFISTGSKTQEFETAYAAYLGIPYAVGTMSCTHSLYLAWRALNVGKGDEIIVPAMTFVATIEALMLTGAQPVFADVDPRTGILDPASAEQRITPRTKAICPVHLYGTMAPMDRFREIADDHKLLLVEDAAHCIEGRGPGFSPGSLSDAAAFSFYATKNITCGEGGAVATRHANVAQKIRLFRNHGINRSAIERFADKVSAYDVEEYGFKSNMYDLQAALLIPQLANIETAYARRAAIVQSYNNAFSDTGLTLPHVPPGHRSALHLYTVRLPSEQKRDKFMLALTERGIGCTVNYRPLSSLTFFRTQLHMRDKDYPNATAIGETTVSLPLYPNLTDAEIAHVIDSVRYIARKLI